MISQKISVSSDGMKAYIRSVGQEFTVLKMRFRGSKCDFFHTVFDVFLP
jgi:hypothetical protein